MSPSVLPMRTMSDRLYAVEAVIPTPTRYEEADLRGFADHFRASAYHGEKNEMRKMVNEIEKNAD